MRNMLADFYRRYIAWRYGYYKRRLAYRRLLKNYEEIAGLKDKKGAVRLRFRCGYDLASSDASACLQMFDDIFVHETYRLRYSRRPEVIVDVGSSIGLFSFYAAMKKPESRIFGMEADPAVFQEYTDNVKLNSLSGRIRPFNLAACGHEGEVSVYHGQQLGWFPCSGRRGLFWRSQLLSGPLRFTVSANRRR